MEEHSEVDNGLGGSSEPGLAVNSAANSAVGGAVNDAANSPVNDADFSTGREGVFVNEPLDVSGLPAILVEDFEALHPNYLRVRLIGDAIFAGLVVVGTAVAAFLATWWWLPLIIGAVLLALTALAAWLQTIEVGHIGYLVREKDFSFRSGVINRNVTTVPFARVQHVSIDRGPLARAFGLATLAMRTAGDGLTVPGMGDDVATRLKALVVDRAGALADEETNDADLAVSSGPPVSGAADPVTTPGGPASTVAPVDPMASSPDQPGEHG